jgi:DNA end-binding protein Ku
MQDSVPTQHFAGTPWADPELAAQSKESGMAPRANWKGYLKVGELSCPIALYSAASTADRVTFHTLNRDTGNRVRREFVDPVTGKPVEREDQVKGYEIDKDRYILIDPEEVAATVPDSDKTLAVSAFIPCREVDTLFFDKPYYLAPAGGMGQDAFTVLRDAMRKASVAALARAVLFRRVRSLIIRTFEDGLAANTLNFDYEVRSAKDAFDDLPDLRIQGEMLDLAKHIISTKSGTFDPAKFDDRYDAAVAELVKAKMAGKPLPKKAANKPSNVVDLLKALRASAKQAGKTEQAVKRQPRHAAS